MALTLNTRSTHSTTSVATAYAWLWGDSVLSLSGETSLEEGQVWEIDGDGIYHLTDDPVTSDPNWTVDSDGIFHIYNQVCGEETILTRSLFDPDLTPVSGRDRYGLSYAAIDDRSRFELTQGSNSGSRFQVTQDGDSGTTETTTVYTTRHNRKICP